MAVGGGVILAASYEARAMGVRTAMPIGAARRLCPELITVSPRMEAYTEASRAVFEIFDDTTPLVEPISIDEAFLDVSGLWRLVGPPEQIAAELRRRVLSDVGLVISVGVARTKFLAKVASGVSKPNGLLVVEPDGELDFLHPLPVGRLWGVGPVTAEKLAARGITTVGQVAALGEGPLILVLGKGSGRHVHALAHNNDPRRVVTGKRRSSIGAQRALGRRDRSFAELEGVLLELVDRVSRRLRNGHRVGRTVTLRFRFTEPHGTKASQGQEPHGTKASQGQEPHGTKATQETEPHGTKATQETEPHGTKASQGSDDYHFTRDTRSHTLHEATASTAAFLDVARILLVARRDEIEQRSLTLLGFTISNLAPDDAVQQSLPFDARSSVELDAALDTVRDRFGSASIGRAALVGKRPGFTVPLLPDPIEG